MRINQNGKIDKIEKRILREAFEGYLPHDILWRQKDGMSDAVGTNWVDEIKKYAEGEIDVEKNISVYSTCEHHLLPLFVL